MKSQRAIIRSNDSLWDAAIILMGFFLIIPDGLGFLSPRLESWIYRWGLYAAFIGIICMFAIKMIKRHHVSATGFSILMFIGLTILIFLFKGSSFLGWYNSFAICLFVTLFAEANRESLDKILLCFLTILEFWIYLNFLLIIIFPGGMYFLEANNSNTNWVLGYKSSFQYYAFPALCFSYINMLYKKQRVRFAVLFTVSLITTIYIGNMMLLVGLLVILAYLAFRLWRYSSVCNIWLFYIIDGLINIFALVLFSGVTENKLINRIISALGKDGSLSSRVSIIWPSTIEQIKRHLLFGNGFYSSQERTEFYGGYLSFIHAHNQVLEYLYIGGIVLLMAVILLHLYIGRSLHRCKNDVSCVLSVFLGVFYLMMIVEVHTRIIAAPFWFMLYLCGSSRQLQQSFTARQSG